MITAIKVFFVFLGVLALFVFLAAIIMSAFIWLDGGFDEESMAEEYYNDDDEEDDKIMWGDARP